MSLSLTQVDEREKGQVPVSIGTSLALEAAFGVYPERDVVVPAPILSIKELWINVRTIIRNCFNALTTENKDKVLPKDLLPAIMEEFNIIESAVIRQTHGDVRVIYYLPDYSSLQRHFPKAILRQAQTPKQMAYRALEHLLITSIAKYPPSQDIRFCDYLVEGQHPEAWMLTHFPVDLMARYQFKKLSLLESHAGNIKAYPQWYTKLTGGKDLQRIPFGRFALQVFGDGNNQFSAMPSKIRNEVLSLAEADGWTSVSTDDRIRMSIRKIQDSALRATIQGLL